MDLSRFNSVDSYTLLNDPKNNGEAIDEIFSPFDNASHLTVVLNQNAEIAYLNGAGAATLGISRRDSRGECWITRFIPGDQRHELILGFEQIVDGNIEPYGTYCNDIVTCDGGRIPFKWVNHLLKSGHDQIEGVCSFGSDSRGPVDDLTALIDIQFPRSIK